MARQGVSTRSLAAKIGTTDMWLGRRVSPSAKIGLTLDEIELIASALGRPVKQFLLPRLDSNQQPCVYQEAA